MKAFYVSQISEHISLTPEGYLVCTKVPIARTGWQDYQPRELEMGGDSPVRVWRDPDEVFDSATIASFEGKTITDGHPPEFIGPANENAYHRGHAQHIRRGAIPGSKDEVLLADLVIKDANLISKIQAGLREISCGYDCNYSPLSATDGPSNGSGSFAQREIRGNHIAVVSNGRAGDKVCIRDSAEQLEERRQKPVLNITRHIFGLGVKAYAKDAEPEAVATAIDDFTAKSEERTRERNKDEDKPKDEKSMTDSEKRITDAVCARMEKLFKKRAADADADDEAIDVDDEDDEAKEAKDEEEEAEEAEDADLIPVTMSGVELPVNPIPGADSIRAHLLATKPLVKRHGDRKAIDGWNELWKMVNAGKKKGATKDGYRRLLNRKKPDEVQRQEDRVRVHDQADASADFVATVAPYHRRNIPEVARELEQKRLTEAATRRKERVN